VVVEVVDGDVRDRRTGEDREGERVSVAEPLGEECGGRECRLAADRAASLRVLNRVAGAAIGRRCGKHVPGAVIDHEVPTSVGYGLMCSGCPLECPWRCLAREGNDANHETVAVVGDEPERIVDSGRFDDVAVVMKRHGFGLSVAEIEAKLGDGVACESDDRVVLDASWRLSRPWGWSIQL